jgi:hypothetical protein
VFVHGQILESVARLKNAAHPIPKNKPSGPAMTDDVISLRLTLQAPFERYTNSNRVRANRWIQMGHCSITYSDLSLDYEFLEVIIHEWSKEPQGDDPGQIGAFRPKDGIIHLSFLPQAFAEVWAASKEGPSTSNMSVALQLEPIDCGFRRMRPAVPIEGGQ